MTISADGEAAYAGTLVNDETRDQLLRMSRGLAVMLLIVCVHIRYSILNTTGLTYVCRYICSRIFLTNPPGDDNAGKLHESAPEEHKHEEEHLKHATPDTNPWVCIILLVFTVGIMAVTAEFVRHGNDESSVYTSDMGYSPQLVESVESVREAGRIQEEYASLTNYLCEFIHSLKRHLSGGLA